MIKLLIIINLILTVIIIIMIGCIYDAMIYNKNMKEKHRLMGKDTEEDIYR